MCHMSYVSVEKLARAIFGSSLLGSPLCTALLSAVTNRAATLQQLPSRKLSIMRRLIQVLRTLRPVDVAGGAPAAGGYDCDERFPLRGPFLQNNRSDGNLTEMRQDP